MPPQPGSQTEASKVVAAAAVSIATAMAVSVSVADAKSVWLTD